jgi:hypothetical protein
MQVRRVTPNLSDSLVDCGTRPAQNHYYRRATFYGGLDRCVSRRRNSPPGRILTLDAIDRAIGDFLVGLPVQRPPDRKPARCVISNNLNAANRLAPRPLPNGLQAFFSKSPVAHSDVSRFAMRPIRRVRERSLGIDGRDLECCTAVIAVRVSEFAMNDAVERILKAYQLMRPL